MQYIQIDVSELKSFADKARKAGSGEFKKALVEFLDGAGVELLRVIEDEIIRLEAVDTRQLLNSFHSKSTENGIYELSEGNLTLEVGTHVQYAQFVNDGHWQNPQGVETRFVPGYWTSDGKFRYSPGADSGMVLKQKFVPGKHYMEHSIVIMEKMFPKIIEHKVVEWFNNYF